MSWVERAVASVLLFDFIGESPLTIVCLHKRNKEGPLQPYEIYDIKVNIEKAS